MPTPVSGPILSWFLLIFSNSMTSEKCLDIFTANDWCFALDVQYLSKESDILFCSITHANLGQILKPGTDLESADPEVFKTPPTCAIWPSFGWDIWG